MRTSVPERTEATFSLPEKTSKSTELRHERSSTSAKERKSKSRAASSFTTLWWGTSIRGRREVAVRFTREIAAEKRVPFNTNPVVAWLSTTGQEGQHCVSGNGAVLGRHFVLSICLSISLSVCLSVRTAFLHITWHGSSRGRQGKNQGSSREYQATDGQTKDTLTHVATVIHSLSTSTEASARGSVARCGGGAGAERSRCIAVAQQTQSRSRVGHSPPHPHDDLPCPTL